MTDAPAAPTFALDARPNRRLVRRVMTGLVALAIGLVVMLIGCVGQPFVKPIPTPPVTLDAKRLEADVRFLSEQCIPRGHLDVQNLEKAADHIRRVFQDCGARVEDQVYEVKGRSYRNVIAHFGPPQGARVVVGAHYDAEGDNPGADDNASGMAGILEVARLFGKEPPDFPLDLVAYTLEEPPHFRTQRMGSAQHAQRLKEAGTPIKAMICLEMIGMFLDEPGTQSYPSSLLKPFYPDRGDFVAVVGRWSDGWLVRRVKGAMLGASSLPVRSINGPRFLPGLDFSDHHPYWDRGFSAVMITDTAFYRNKGYHTPRDTADRLDFVRMAKVVQGTRAAILVVGRN